MQLFQPGDHGSTFGGNPLAAAVGCAALEVTVNEELDRRADRLGKTLKTGIERFDSRCIAAVRGRGLLLGVELHASAGPARDYADRLLAEGVICKDSHVQVLRIAPPLVIDDSDIDWLLERLHRVLS